MQRFHVHLGVDDLARSVAFYTKLFAAERAQLKARAQSADMALREEGATSCCYARSDKHWITDPQGIVWEHFHTLGNIPLSNEPGTATVAGACCASAASP